MKVIPRLKTNRFTATIIPSPASLFSSCSTVQLSDSGDSSPDFGIALNTSTTKGQLLEFAQIVNEASIKAHNGDNPAHETLNIDPSKL